MQKNIAKNTHKSFKVDKRIFFFREAKGYLEADNEHFTVMAGSKVKKQVCASASPGTIRYRKQYSSLLRDGILIDNITFDSPSGAAQFVCLSSINGKEVWKTADGIPLSNILKNMEFYH